MHSSTRDTHLGMTKESNRKQRRLPKVRERSEGWFIPAQVAHAPFLIDIRFLCQYIYDCIYRAVIGCLERRNMVKVGLERVSQVSLGVRAQMNGGGVPR